jgi:hypothetical protein
MFCTYGTNNNNHVILARTAKKHLGLSRHSKWAGIAQSVKRLATGWTVRGVESRWRRDIPHASLLALGPIQPSVQWVPSFSRGLKRPGHGVYHLFPSSAAVKERVELYFYFSSAPSRLLQGELKCKHSKLLFVRKLTDLTQSDCNAAVRQFSSSEIGTVILLVIVLRMSHATLALHCHTKQ